nr:reverse transcriptase domain-containing protein [Tanacetum cinerariifolium]
MVKCCKIHLSTGTAAKRPHTTTSRIHTPGQANGALSYFQLGDEGSSSEGTKLNLTFITAENEGLQAFMDQFKSECSHIKGVPFVLRISTFMHGHGHLELAKKLNERIQLMKCSKESGCSLRKKWLLGQQKWYVLPKGTKGRNGMKVINMITEEGNHKRPFEEGRYGQMSELTFLNEGLQPFMDRFKSECSHIKGVPFVLRISTFMHGHGHLELAKKLNERIPNTVDEMFKRVRVFIKEKVVAGSAEMGRNGMKVINMITEEGNHKRPFKEGRSGLMSELTFLVIP